MLRAEEKLTQTSECERKKRGRYTETREVYGDGRAPGRRGNNVQEAELECYPNSTFVGWAEQQRLAVGVQV